MNRFALLAMLAVAAACTRAPELDSIERDGARALQSGDLTGAEKLAAEGGRLAAARRDATWEQRFRILHIEVLVEQRRHADALGLLERETAGTVAAPLEARLLLARGRARCLTGRADDSSSAQRDLETAARLAAAQLATELAAEIARHRGNCAFSQADFATAEGHFRTALEIAQQQQLPLLEAKATGSLGLIRIQTRRFDDAISWLERALALATSLKTDLVAVKTLTNLGWCQYMLGDYERALSFLTRATDLARARGYAGEAQLALQLSGNAFYRQRDSTRAADAYERSLDIARDLQDDKRAAELLGNLAIVALDQGRVEAAEAFVGQAFAIKTKLGDVAAIPHSLMTQGDIRARRGQQAAAEQLYQQVLGSPHADRELQWEARAALGGLYMKAGQPRRAEAEFSHAFAVIDQSRDELRQTEHKISFLSSLQRFQDAYVDLLVDTGDTGRALEVADRSRARQLRETLGVAAAPDAASIATFRRTARALDAVVLFYWLGPARSFLWVVSADGVRLHRLPGEEEIATRVGAHQRLILRSRDPLAESSPDAVWLYHTLVGPVESQLHAGSRVVVIPDGALHDLNPETLVAGTPAPHYWLEDVTLSIAPSLSVLASDATSARPARAARSILLIGDPLPAGDEFPVLHHASREVSRIADQFAAADRSVYAGKAASSQAYLDSDPSRFAYIHFAAHATANREAPLESAVILSPGDDSFKLYARDVLRARIHAELVTISACRSAGSRAYSGEGLVGLTWAFLSAGAGSVVAGLWNVDDASTPDLMAELYAGLSAGYSPAEALRRAKLQLLRSSSAYRKPFYWAPFVTYTRMAAPAELTVTPRHARPSGVI